MRISRLVALLSLAACSSPVVDDAGAFDSEADYRAQRAAAVEELEAQVGRPTASDVSACRAVAVGEQACGGPTSFSVYSIETATADRVQTAAEAVTALDRRANRQFEFTSTCALLTAPPLTVEEGTCVASR